MGIAYDENGNEIGSNKWPLNAKDVYALGKYPMEMGYGLLYYEHTFYDIESLEMKFFISKDFQVESIFKDGLCDLNYVKENRDLIITVKENEIIDSFNINDTDRLINVVRKTGDLDIFNFCGSANPENNLNINELKEVIINEKKKELGSFVDYIGREKDCYYCNSREPLKSISRRVFTREQFIDGVDLLNSEELHIINDIHLCLNRVYVDCFRENFIFRFTKKDYERYDSSGTFILHFANFFFLVYDGPSTYKHSGFLYWIFDYKGKKLSETVYYNIDYPNIDSCIWNSWKRQTLMTSRRYHNCMFTYHRESSNDGGMLNIKGHKLTEIPYPSFMFDKRSWVWSYINVSPYYDYIHFNDKYYTFLGEELSVEEIHIEKKEVIKKLDFSFTPLFDYNQIELSPKFEISPRFIDGKICVPFYNEFIVCIMDIKKMNNQIQKNIESIELIGTYKEDSEDGFSLYYIKYRPQVSFDASGHIIIQVNTSNIFPALNKAE